MLLASDSGVSGKMLDVRGKMSDRQTRKGGVGAAPTKSRPLGRLILLLISHFLPLNQNNPVIFPSLSQSMLNAAGTLGSPGIVIMSPV